MTRLGDVEQIVVSHGHCVVCGTLGDLGNHVCQDCWDRGYGKGKTRQAIAGQPIFSGWEEERKEDSGSPGI